MMPWKISENHEFSDWPHEKLGHQNQAPPQAYCTVPIQYYTTVQGLISPGLIERKPIQYSTRLVATRTVRYSLQYSTRLMCLSYLG